MRSEVGETRDGTGETKRGANVKIASKGRRYCRLGHAMCKAAGEEAIGGKDSPSMRAAKSARPRTS